MTVSFQIPSRWRYGSSRLTRKWEEIVMLMGTDLDTRDCFPHHMNAWCEEQFMDAFRVEVRLGQSAHDPVLSTPPELYLVCESERDAVIFQLRWGEEVADMLK